MNGHRVAFYRTMTFAAISPLKMLQAKIHPSFRRVMFMAKDGCILAGVQKSPNEAWHTSVLDDMIMS